MKEKTGKFANTLLHDAAQFLGQTGIANQGGKVEKDR